jgi:hypothetical protein
MRIFLIEPYFTGSHRAWAEGYARMSRHEVHLITHEGRFWKWRMQGGPVTLAGQIDHTVAEHGVPDVVVASSMTNLAPTLGMARRSLGRVPVALYMHENQLTYPVSPRDLPDATYTMVSWTSMAAADLVMFNSEFHRDAWFAAIGPFLKQFPDYGHGPKLVNEVAHRSEVMPVGVDLSRLDGPTLRAEPPLVLWNQRCEYDKGPGEFVDAMLDLAGAGHDFRIALAGERFVSEPSDFDRLRDQAGGRIVHDGFAAETEYQHLLRSADIVVSTAHQEFFGIAITEAIYAGAFPLLPNRLVYPERLPPAHHDRCLYDGHDDLVAKLGWALEHGAERRRVAGVLHGVMAPLDWREVAPRYDARFEGLAAES